MAAELDELRSGERLNRRARSLYILTTIPILAAAILAVAAVSPLRFQGPPAGWAGWNVALPPLPGAAPGSRPPPPGVLPGPREPGAWNLGFVDRFGRRVGGSYGFRLRIFSTPAAGSPVRASRPCSSSRFHCISGSPSATKQDLDFSLGLAEPGSE